MAHFKQEAPVLEAYSGFYPLDIYFPSNGMVVEINGPTHFYDVSNNLLSKYVLKKRLFQQAGIQYIDLNYHECLNENREVKAEIVIEKIS